MVKIHSVSGNCLVMDGFTCTTAVPGMTLEMKGSTKVYVLMTGPSGLMDLTINNKKLKLRGDSLLRVRGTKAPEFVQRRGTLHETKILIGKIWAKIKGPEPLEEIYNAAVGIRG
jgi:hypothetical protein